MSAMERISMCIRSLPWVTLCAVSLTLSLTVLASVAFFCTCSDSSVTVADSFCTAVACSAAPWLSVWEASESLPAPSKTIWEDWSIREIVWFRASEILSIAAFILANSPL